MNSQTLNALAEMVKAAHVMMGGNPNDRIEFSICVPKNPCPDCLTIYPIQSEDDPCPNCEKLKSNGKTL